ncbi:hypothetical protein D3C76_1558910 [compost metagenome]
MDKKPYRKSNRNSGWLLKMTLATTLVSTESRKASRSFIKSTKSMVPRDTGARNPIYG